MKKNASKQYTIRNVPENIDRTLKMRAKESGKSLNQTILEALARGTEQSLKPKRDLSFLIGSLSKEGAQAMDLEIEAQRQIDPRLWK